MDVQVGWQVSGGICWYFHSFFSPEDRAFYACKECYETNERIVSSLTKWPMDSQQVPISICYCRAVYPRARNISWGKCLCGIAETWQGNHRHSLHCKSRYCITCVPFTVDVMTHTTADHEMLAVTSDGHTTCSHRGHYWQPLHIKVQQPFFL